MYEKLLELYAKVPSRSLSADLEYFMRTGYVISSPDFVLIGRRIDDGWFVHAAVAKNLGDLLRAMPYYLPYVGWAREARGRNNIRWHSIEQLRKAYDRHSLFVPIAGNTGRIWRGENSEASTAPASSR